MSETKEYRATVLSLGAGVQSSALLLACDRGELPFKLDFAVFADTQAEPQEVYDWLDFLEKSVSIPIVRCTKGNLAVDMMKASRFASVPFFIRNPDGSRGILRRQCTKEYKLEPVVTAIRQTLGVGFKKRMKGRVKVLVGISRDEAHRMKPSRTPWIDNCWPLVDAGWRRNTCADYVEKILGRKPPRSACFMCPYHGDKEWKHLKENQPVAFEKAVKFDELLRLPGTGRMVNKVKGSGYVHSSLVPLGQIDFSKPSDQQDFFGNECEGMCGV